MRGVTSLLCALLLASEASARQYHRTPAFLGPLLFGPPQHELDEKQKQAALDEEESVLSPLMEIPWPVKVAIGCAPFCITGVQALFRPRKPAPPAPVGKPTFQATSPQAEVAAAMAPLVASGRVPRLRR